MIELSKLHKTHIPKVNSGYIDYYTYLDLWDFDIYTLIFTTESKKFYLPEAPEKGILLTLVIIK